MSFGETESMEETKAVSVVSNGVEISSNGDHHHQHHHQINGGDSAVVVKGSSSSSSVKKNRIQVSNTKKPLYFYVNLAKRYIRQHNEIELSALGMGAYISIATVVTVSEILKSTGLVTEKKIMTSTVDMKDEAKGKTVQKAKIEIFLKKIENAESPSSTERWTVTAAEAIETPVQVMRETENKA
ncbi:hypothetical protein Scep_029932 [Stephania cephalantha]|uniref:DNA/RNA-binding protein Alba-like domain-containing protein n=1 Tax=Stephania cephalantha TaxID=152367 RepID=A0AAP0HGF0_9MAGN